jgi:putative redox protein
MKKLEISILNSRGLKLAGTLDSPDGSVKAYAVYGHCFTCSKDLKAIANIDRSLSAIGIATLRFDMTGIGDSEGNFIDTNFTTQIDDFLSAAKYLEKNYKASKLFIGHSLGGCVALYSALKLHYVKAVATIAAPAEPSHLALKLKRTRERAIKNGVGETEIGGVKFKFKPQFFEDLEKYNLKKEIPKLNKPFLILHSPVDAYTEIDNAAILFQNARHPKSFISLDDIDHLMLKEKDALYVGKLIGTWAEKYL